MSLSLLHVYLVPLSLSKAKPLPVGKWRFPRNTPASYLFPLGGVKVSFGFSRCTPYILFGVHVGEEHIRVFEVHYDTHGAARQVCHIFDIPVTLCFHNQQLEWLCFRVNTNPMERSHMAEKNYIIKLSNQDGRWRVDNINVKGLFAYSIKMLKVVIDKRSPPLPKRVGFNFVVKSSYFSGESLKFSIDEKHMVSNLNHIISKHSMDFNLVRAKSRAADKERKKKEETKKSIPL